MNDKTIFRRAKDRDNPYVMIDKSIFEDNALSWKAKGLMGYLLSRPNDWIVRMGDLVKRSPGGMTEVRHLVRELESHGYLIRRRSRDERGQFQWVTEVHEVPSIGLPSMDEPSTDAPQAENETLLSTNLTEIECTKKTSPDGECVSPGTDLWPSDTTAPIAEKESPGRAKLPTDYLGMSAHCAEIRHARCGDTPDWAMLGAEGADPFYPVVSVFCTMTGLDPGVLTPRNGKRWLKQYAKIAQDNGLSPGELLEAHRHLPAEDRGAWHIEHNKWGTPYADSYIEALVLAGHQIRSGTITHDKAKEWSKAF